MKVVQKQIICTFALLPLLYGCNDSGLSRSVISLNGEGWKFAKDSTSKLDASACDFDDSKWQSVEVPHDWAISGPFKPESSGGSGKLPWRGVGWYRRTINVSSNEFAEIKNGAAAWLEFDGVMARPEIYVNGNRAGSWDYGYMSFNVDATPFVKEGANVIAVRADTRNHNSRWYPGAGIYRAVRLVLAPPVHVLAGTEYVTTPEISKNSAVVRVQFELTNRTETATSVSPVVRICSQDGIVVSKKSINAKLGAKGAYKCDFEVEVSNPQLWDFEKAHLYIAKIGIGNGDEVPIRFGIRKAEFTADDGFHLNGKRVQLKGVNLHSDMGVLGMAFNRSVMKRQLEIMKGISVNALRTSHNACDPQVLELCDEMGIVVWNECFDKWDTTSGRMKDENLEEYVARNLRRFAQRDRNHPSVVAWSIGNEIPVDGSDNGPKRPKVCDGMSAERFRIFRAAIREFDTTRPVGIGCNSGGNKPEMFAELDISGWNYGGQYKNIKSRLPLKPVVYTESASAVSSFGAFDLPPAKHKTDYDVANREVGSYEHNAMPWSDIPDLEFDRMERDRYCAGEFVWTGLDYLGEPAPYMHYSGFPQMKELKESELARSSYFGITDLTGMPKERYWLYRSHWNNDVTTLHISPHWNWEGRNVAKLPVYVYTDGDEAELFLNGRSLGKRKKGVIQRPENFAFGKQVTASSFERRGEITNSPAAAVDGINKTRWCAKNDKKGEWLQVDLGEMKEFCTVFVSSERGDGSYAWTILVSDDGNAWREYDKKPIGEVQKKVAKSETARFVRVVFDDLKNGAWASIRDILIGNCTDAFRTNPYYDICDKYRLRWFDVPYEPGELKAVAYKNGSIIAEEVMRTALKPEAVKLTAEKDVLPPDGETCVFVQVDVVDANGTRNPWATDRVSFSLTGPGKIVAVGNGNPRAHEPFTKTDSHPLYFGKAVAVLRRNKGETGVITLTASINGLKSAKVSLK